MKWILIAYGIIFGMPITAAVFWFYRNDSEHVLWDCRHVYGGLVTHQALLYRNPRDVLKDPPGTSWRFQIQRFIEDVHMTPYELDERWTSAENRWLRDEPSGPDFFCPQGSNRTSVMAITGPDTWWTEGEKRTFEELPPSYVVFVLGVSSQCHWMQPGDISRDEVPALLKGEVGPNSTRIGSAFWLAFADGTLLRIRTPDDPLALRPFLSITESAAAAREWLDPWVLETSHVDR